MLVHLRSLVLAGLALGLLGSPPAALAGATCTVGSTDDVCAGDWRSGSDDGACDFGDAWSHNTGVSVRAEAFARVQAGGEDWCESYDGFTDSTTEGRRLFVRIDVFFMHGQDEGEHGVVAEARETRTASEWHTRDRCAFYVNGWHEREPRRGVIYHGSSVCAYGPFDDAAAPAWGNMLP